MKYNKIIMKELPNLEFKWKKSTDTKFKSKNYQPTVTQLIDG